MAKKRIASVADLHSTTKSGPTPAPRSRSIRLWPGARSTKVALKEQWGKLTDDDLNVINGRRDQLEGKIQERYGYEKDQVRREMDNKKPDAGSTPRVSFPWSRGGHHGPHRRSRRDDRQASISETRFTASRPPRSFTNA